MEASGVDKETVNALSQASSEQPEKNDKKIEAEKESPFLTAPTVTNEEDEGAGESEEKEEEKKDDDKPEDEEEKDEEKISESEFVFLGLPKTANGKADLVELLVIESEIFNTKPVISVKGYSVYPYQTLPGKLNGFWNIVTVAPSGHGKTTLLRGLTLLSLAINPEREVLFISSKPDPAGFIDDKYPRSEVAIKGSFENATVTILSDKDKIKSLAEKLPHIMKDYCQNMIVLIDDLLTSDPHYDDLCAIRDIFILTGRQYAISVGYAAHLVSGVNYQDVKNEAQTFAFVYSHRNFIGNTRRYLDTQLGFTAQQIRNLILLISIPINDEEPPIDRGWVFISPGYNLAIAGSRIISLSWLDRTEELNRMYPQRPVHENVPLKRSIEEKDQETPAAAEATAEIKPKKLRPNKHKLFNKVENEEASPTTKRPEKSSSFTANLITCPDCRLMFESVKSYNRHQTSKHGGLKRE